MPAPGQLEDKEPAGQLCLLQRIAFCAGGATSTAEDSGVSTAWLCLVFLGNPSQILLRPLHFKVRKQSVQRS